jgi:peroxiredoxin
MTVRAPAFKEGLTWLNSAPLLISELRGRYILLDFFTFGCINCLNNLQTVRSLHARFGKDLCVIGIHIGKFEHEKEIDALQDALRRYGIEFAVVNDPEHHIADAYAVKGWPTTILVDNRGYIAHHASGEQKLTEWVGRLSSCGLQAVSQKSNQRVREKELAYPQKVLTAPNFLAVSNTRNNEVWLSDYDGRVFDVIEADNPMGMSFKEGKLYICESHTGRIISYDTKSKAKHIILEGLRNPFDIVLAGNKLTVAIAGSHRINSYSLDSLLLLDSYGNGFEALRDGKADECQLAQPAGMALMDETLYFVDAESSSLRKSLL